MSVITKPTEEEVEVIDEIEEIYIKVENYIREHGWTRGTLRDINTGAVCLLGAFTEVIYGPNGSDGVINEAGALVLVVTHPALRSLVKLCDRSLITFNDHEAESVEDIYSLLRDARSVLKSIEE